MSCHICFTSLVIFGYFDPLFDCFSSKRFSTPMDFVPYRKKNAATVATEVLLQTGGIQQDVEIYYKRNELEASPFLDQIPVEFTVHVKITRTDGEEGATYSLSIPFNTCDGGFVPSDPPSPAKNDSCKPQYTVEHPNIVLVKLYGSKTSGSAKPGYTFRIVRLHNGEFAYFHES